MPSVDNFLSSWYLWAGGVLVGALLVVFGHRPTKKIIKEFKSRAEVIKRYWLFVVPFSLVVALAYVLVWVYVPVESRDAALAIVGAGAGLVFAIFVGYFAFLQVAESRSGKLIEDARSEIRMGRYGRAISAYEKVVSIDPRNFTVLSDLLEAYLIEGRERDFNDRLPQIGRYRIEPREKLIELYLCALKELLKEHPPEARKSISQAINYVKEKPASLERLAWDFDDLKKSSRYKDLRGDSRRLLDNLIKYLSRSLGNDLERYEAGDYLLEG